MTNDDIDKLEAGSDLDRLVAERVMGFSPYTHVGVYLDENRKIRNTGEYANRAQYWSPSTNIAHAWEVVEKMSTTTKDGWHLSTYSCNNIAIYEYEGGRDHKIKPGTYESDADSMPLAICRAALKAINA